jgi:hypothetical protein
LERHEPSNHAVAHGAHDEEQGESHCRKGAEAGSNAAGIGTFLEAALAVDVAHGGNLEQPVVEGGPTKAQHNAGTGKPLTEEKATRDGNYP